MRTARVAHAKVREIEPCHLVAEVAAGDLMVIWPDFAKDRRLP
jgi:hypothetical protein